MSIEYHVLIDGDRIGSIQPSWASQSNGY